jgi:hypothetical protein
MKRPVGVTLFALFFGTVASWNLAILRSANFAWLLDAAGTVVTVLWFAMAVVSGVAAVGLWRMRRWGPKVAGATGGLLVALAVARHLTEVGGLDEESIVGVGTLLLLMWFGFRYTRDTITAAHERILAMDHGG